MEKKKNSLRFPIRTLTWCAVLAAVSVIFARLLIPMPDATTRLSIEAVPVFLSGMLFGPLAGGLVGFVSDAVGTLFSGYGFNPIFCVPPILYGVTGGLFRQYLGRKCSPLRLTVSLLPGVVLGSVIYQSFALAWVYYNSTFLEGLILKLSTRSVQFAVTLVLDVAVLFFLMKTNLFQRLGVWPPVSKGGEGSK